MRAACPRATPSAIGIGYVTTRAAMDAQLRVDRRAEGLAYQRLALGNAYSVSRRIARSYRMPVSVCPINAAHLDS
jgi:hypothetical protein